MLHFSHVIPDGREPVADLIVVGECFAEGLLMVGNFLLQFSSEIFGICAVVSSCEKQLELLLHPQKQVNFILVWFRSDGYQEIADEI